MKIAIFLPNYIGDILQTTPAIRFLKRNLPSERLIVFVREECEILLDENNYLDEIVIKKTRWHTLKKIFLLKPDVVLLFRKTFFNSLAAYLPSPQKIFSIKENYCGSYRFDCLSVSELCVEKFFNIAEPVKTELTELDFFGWQSQKIRESVEKKLREIFSNDKKLIVISPVSSRKTKMLFLSQYLELLKMLKEVLSSDYEIVMVGGKDDEIFLNSLSDICRVKSLAGKLNLKELGYILSVASVFISPDSGPAFIAQAVGCPTVLFFTSTLPERYGPYPENVKIIYHPQICSPCYKNKCYKNYKCVAEFPVYEIRDKVMELV